MIRKLPLWGWWKDKSYKSWSVNSKTSGNALIITSSTHKVKMILMIWTAPDPDKDHTNKLMIVKVRMTKIKKRIKYNMRIKSPLQCRKIHKTSIKKVGIMVGWERIIINLVYNSNNSNMVGRGRWWWWGGRRRNVYWKGLRRRRKNVTTSYRTWSSTRTVDCNATLTKSSVRECSREWPDRWTVHSRSRLSSTCY